jgi:signal transduction protein with GAF and PtsI domain
VIELDLGDAEKDSQGLGAVSARAEFLAEGMGLLLKDVSFGDFCRSLLESLLKAMPSEAASFLEVDWSRNCFFFRASLGSSSDRIDHFEFPLSQGVAGHVFESRSPSYLSQVADDSHHLKSIAKAVGFETRNMAALPVVIRGRVFGVLELINRLGDPEFSPMDRATLETLISDFAKLLEVRLMIGWAMHAAARKAADGSGKEAA